jgi:AcrR family transcriptional regulator
VEHKERTWRTLRQAGLELFASQGYDATTTEQIAERAGVSPRTFFRYFPTKESVIYAGELEFLETLIDRYPIHAASRGEFDAMAATFVELAPKHVRNRAQLLLYQKAIASSVTLRGVGADHQAADADRFAVAIAAQRGVDGADEAAAMLAFLGISTVWRAVDAWLRGPARRKLETVVAEQFALLARLVGNQ